MNGNDDVKQIPLTGDAEQAAEKELVCPLQNRSCDRERCGWWADTCCAMLALSDAPLALEEVKTALEGVTTTLNNFRQEFSH